MVLGAAPGAASADDCSPEDSAGSLRSPVVAFGDRARVLGFSYVGYASSADVFSLTAGGVAGTASVTQRQSPTLSPTLLRRAGGAAEVVQWRQGSTSNRMGNIVATPLSGARAGASRVLVPAVAFPGYLGVAAAASPDGTITLAYATSADDLTGGPPVALRRISPDGVLGPVFTVPAVEASLNQRLSTDAQGTTYALLPGQKGGVGVRWPAVGDPQVINSSRLTRRTIDDAGFPTAVVADGQGGAWMRIQSAKMLSLAHIGEGGVSVTQISTLATTSAGPAVTADGSALIAWSGKRFTTVLERVDPNGRRALPRRFGAAGRISALAIDPATDKPAALLIRRRSALVFARANGSTVLLRRRNGYAQSEASLALGANGRAWAVWEEASDRLESTCNLFALHEAVRWATLGPAARQTTSRQLANAPIVREFE